LFHGAVAGTLFAIPLARESSLDALPLAWFEIEGVALGLPNNVFLQNFALEAPQSALQGFPIDNVNLGQTVLLTHGGGPVLQSTSFWKRKATGTRPW
jgi:hypothetical protein